jgi:glycerate kinase
MVAKQSFRGNRPSCIAGAGAAGGLGFGLHVFLGAPLVSGFRLFAEHAGLESEIRRFQLVVTGEGAIDRSSLSMGKGVGEIASLCARNRIPCIGLAGSITDASLARERFSFVSAMTPGLTTLEAAMSQPVLWLERLASNAARSWSSRSTK